VLELFRLETYNSTSDKLFSLIDRYKYRLYKLVINSIDTWKSQNYKYCVLQSQWKWHIVSYKIISNKLQQILKGNLAKMSRGVHARTGQQKKNPEIAPDRTNPEQKHLVYDTLTNFGFSNREYLFSISQNWFYQTDKCLRLSTNACQLLIESEIW